MAVRKKAKTFVRHIARQFVDKHGDSAFLESNLRKLYNAAILDLPDKELLKHLSNYADSYVVLLRKSIRKLLNEGVDRENSEDFPAQLPLNLYLANQAKVRKAAVRELPMEEQLQICIQNLVNKLEEDDMKLRKTYKNFKWYMKMEKPESYTDTALDILSSSTSTVAVAPDVKARMMGLYLRGLEPIVKKCLAEQDIDRAVSVQRKVKAFLNWSQIMKNPHQTFASLEAEMEVTVNITRNYLELVLLSYRPSNQGDLLNLETLLYSFVTYMMDHNESHVLDILLRLKAVNSTNRAVLLSLIKFALMQLPVLAGEPAERIRDYLVYMVTVARFAAALPTLRDIVENALTLPAPPATVGFLKDKLDMSEWPLHSKFQGKMISHFLLKEAPESVISDILKVLLETRQGEEETETSGPGESSSTPAFFMDSGPGSSKHHQQVGEEEEEVIEEVDSEIEDSEENARTTASRQKKKLPPDYQDPEAVEDSAEDPGDTAIQTSVPKFVIDDNVPQVYDFSVLDFSTFLKRKSSVNAQLPDAPTFPQASRNIGYSPRKSSQSPEKPLGFPARCGGGLSLSDEEEKDDSKPEFPKKMDIIEELENSDVPADELCIPKISRHKMKGNLFCKDYEEGKDGEAVEEGKTTRKKSGQMKRSLSPSNGVHFSDLESGLKSIALASPRKNRRKMLGLLSTSKEDDKGEKLLEESVHAEVPSSPVILSHLSNSDNLTGGKSSPQKSTRRRKVSQSSTVTNQSNQDEELDTLKPPRTSHRNFSGVSTTTNGSVKQEEEEGVSLIRRSLRKRTVSGSSVGTNQSDVDAEMQGTEAKVRAKARGRRREVPVPDTLAEEEEKEDEEEASECADTLPKGRRKPKRSSKDGVASGKTMELETTNAGKKSARKSAAMTGEKRYSLRSRLH